MAGNKKKRCRVWTTEDRAAHRVFEKSRREAFNDSMIDLARQIPSLKGTRRLTKHMIVDHSIARHQAYRKMCLLAAQEIRDLLSERDQLLVEVNQWRSASRAQFVPREAVPIGQQLQNVLNAEKESFGSFPNGFGDNPSEDGSNTETECGTSEEGPCGLVGAPIQQQNTHLLASMSISAPEINDNEVINPPIPVSLDHINSEVYDFTTLLPIATNHSMADSVNDINSVNFHGITAADTIPSAQLHDLTDNSLVYFGTNPHFSMATQVPSSQLESHGFPFGDLGVTDQFHTLYACRSSNQPKSSFPT